jgi:Mrp family chromosome partitioning ATPase
LKQHFAYIVIDAPPVLPIADSHILAGLSDKVLFVVRARRTPRELFQHAVEGFESDNVLGAVLNDVDYQRSRYAYAYEYYKKAA